MQMSEPKLATDWPTIRSSSSANVLWSRLQQTYFQLIHKARPFYLEWFVKLSSFLVRFVTAVVVDMVDRSAKMMTMTAMRILMTRMSLTRKRIRIKEISKINTTKKISQIKQMTMVNRIIQINRKYRRNQRNRIILVHQTVARTNQAIKNKTQSKIKRIVVKCPLLNQIRDNRISSLL